VARGRIGCVKPRVQAAAPRIAAHTTATIRKRGRAGMVDRERIVRRDSGLCQRCLRAGRDTVGCEVDHIVPLHKGGPDTDANKELLCVPCHLEKSREDMQG
jgi:5-methylcytosine-specific restriction endonuclease McrA